MDETVEKELTARVEAMLVELENLHARLDATEALIREAEEYNRKLLSQ